MFGSHSPKIPTPPSYMPPPAFQAPQQYQQPNASQSQYNSYIPQVQSADAIAAGGLGIPQQGSPEGDVTAYAPWLSLRNNPTDQQNVQAAEQHYLQGANPALQQNISNLAANGQGGSSYGAQLIGAEAGQNQYNAFNAGINQQEADFQNVLNARNQLYSQPIGLQQAQANAGVQRAFGIAGLDQQQAQGQNAYNMQGTQMQNAYNLGTNQNQNQFGLSNYQNQLGGYNAQLQNDTYKSMAQQNLGLGVAKLFAGGIGGGTAGQFGSGIAQGMFGGGGAGGIGSGGGAGINGGQMQNWGTL